MELLFYKQFFGGKNIFTQLFLEERANKNDRWKGLLKSDFVHSAHFY